MTELFEDHIYRVGGDEFVIVVKDWTNEDFADQIDLLKQKMREKKVSISIGMLWKPTIDNLEQMLKQADFIMYEEKKQYHLLNDGK